MVSSRAAVAWDFPGHAAMSPAPTSTAPTVTAVAPLLPSLVAVIVASPGLAAPPRPVASTVATAGALLVQVTTRPARGLPLASCGVAESCSAPPSGSAPVPGLTATAAIGTGTTVTTAAPLRPSLVAVMVALPGLSALTRPVASTSAAVGAVLAHVTDRLRTGVPLAIGVAVSCSVAPTNAPGAVGLTVTALTGGRSWQKPLPASVNVPPAAGMNAQL